MSFTNFPNGFTSFNAPDGPGHYSGWWGKNIWFVDDDGGGDEATRTGNSPDQALKTIQEAITRAGMHDTIFLKPREIDQDTHSSHGYYTGTNIIPANKTGLAIIGTGRGIGIGSSVQCMVEPDSGSTDVAIFVQSPAVSIENLGVKAVTSSGGAIYADLSTAQAYGMTISNCFFKSFLADGATTGAIDMDTTHWVTIQHCYFKECGVGIGLTSGVSGVRFPIIRDCDFAGLPAKWSGDIILGDVWGLVIDNCRFHHAQPTGGTRNFFIDCLGGTSSHGMISNCYFAVAGSTVATLMELKGAILNSGCWGADKAVGTA